MKEKKEKGGKGKGKRKRGTRNQKIPLLSSRAACWWLGFILVFSFLLVLVGPNVAVVANSYLLWLLNLFANQIFCVISAARVSRLAG